MAKSGHIAAHTIFGSVEDSWGKSLTEAQRGRGKRLKD
jgi:hypothetical protein